MPTPTYEMSLGDTQIKKRLESFRIIDRSGDGGDTLQITLNSRNLALPRTGVALAMKIGYEETTTWDIGTFIIQEIDYEEPDNTVMLRGISQPQGITATAAVQTTNAQRSWNGATFFEIVNEVCFVIGYSVKMDPILRDIPMPYTEQNNESDAAFLHRITKQRNGFVKFHDNLAIFQSFDAQPLGRITINYNENTMRYKFSRYEQAAIETVVTKYMDVKSGEVKMITTRAPVDQLGRGNPGRTQGKTIIPDVFPDKNTAEHVGNAVIKAYQREAEGIQLWMPTEQGLDAEKAITLAGFPNEIDKTYIAKIVVTSYRIRSGMISHLILQQPAA